MRKTILILVPAMSLLFASCSEGWTDAQKEEFMKGCVSKAPSEELKPVQEQMCKCMLDKIIVKYPSYKKAEKEMNDADMEVMATECAEKIVPAK
jgi:hypothetical protein